MNDKDLDRLAALIAAELDRLVQNAPEARASWLRNPVRPAPPARSGEAPTWAAAAQALGDIAPVRKPLPSEHRDDPAVATAAIRAAAAGRAPPRSPGAPPTNPRTGRVSGRRRGTAIGREVKVGVSNRHVHLSEADARVLFGDGGLQAKRPLTQPGQFAAEQSVTALAGTARLDAVRVVGPSRGETQLELARSDAVALGIAPPVAGSGHLEESIGGVTLEGTHGRIALKRGVIVAGRHLHLSPGDAAAWGLSDGDTISVRCGTGHRAVTLHGVRVRSGTAHATELHLDKDEAYGAGVESGAIARIVGLDAASKRRRPLFTERDVVSAARRGETIPPDALLTPSARDRARALGLTAP